MCDRRILPASGHENISPSYTGTDAMADGGSFAPPHTTRRLGERLQVDLCGFGAFKDLSVDDLGGATWLGVVEEAAM